MVGVSADNLQAILGALGELLARAGESAHLVVVGGSGLLGIGIASRPTADVDVVALVDGGRLVSAAPLPAAVAEAASRVAQDFALGPQWLNAGRRACSTKRRGCLGGSWIALSASIIGPR